MNKFLTCLVLFAAAVCCSAYDKGDYESETEYLSGNEMLFAPFCMEERQQIISDIRTRAATQSSVVFNIFFNTANEISDEVLSTQRKAIEQFAKQIATPDEQPDDKEIPKDEIDALILKGKEDIASKENLVSRLFTSVQSAGRVFLKAADTSILKRLVDARKSLGGETLLKGILQTCKQVSTYNKSLEEHFNEAKNNLKADKTEGEIQNFIDSVTLQSLKCYTTKRITRLNGLCDIFKEGAGPLLKFLGIDSNYQLPQLDQ